jgi:hypothetical protein
VGWLPDDFAHPTRVDVSTGQHLRPIRADDVDIDFPAIMGSRDRLVGTDVERALDEFVPRWLGNGWPVRRPRLVGRDLPWAEWIALPDR